MAAPNPYERTCPECGAVFSTLRADATFCGSSCRQKWNNRRLQRGAQLYDLFMGMRYERKLFAHLKLWGVMCRLAARWYHEDRSRKTWSDPNSFIAANPDLRGDVWLGNSKKPR